MIGMLLNVVHRQVHKNIYQRCLKSFITNSTLLTMHRHKAELKVKCVEALTTTVCYTAVFSVVTQRPFPQREKRDDTKNGCVADYYNYESPQNTDAELTALILSWVSDDTKLIDVDCAVRLVVKPRIWPASHSCQNNEVWNLHQRLSPWLLHEAAHARRV